LNHSDNKNECLTSPPTRKRMGWDNKINLKALPPGLGKCYEAKPSPASRINECLTSPPTRKRMGWDNQANLKALRAWVMLRSPTQPDLSGLRMILRLSPELQVWADRMACNDLNFMSVQVGQAYLD
jgi:hypothetical protein